MQLLKKPSKKQIGVFGVNLVLDIATYIMCSIISVIGIVLEPNTTLITKGILIIIVAGICFCLFALNQYLTFKWICTGSAEFGKFTILTIIILLLFGFGLWGILAIISQIVSVQFKGYYYLVSFFIFFMAGYITTNIMQTRLFFTKNEKTNKIKTSGVYMLAASLFIECLILVITYVLLMMTNLVQIVEIIIFCLILLFHGINRFTFICMYSKD